MFAQDRRVGKCKIMRICIRTGDREAWGIYAFSQDKGMGRHKIYAHMYGTRD